MAASIHNPRNLTPAQVGNGWRLLDSDEWDYLYLAGAIERWSSVLTEWRPAIGKGEDVAYRTNRTREQLAQSRRS